jgi:hypothetical protein
LVATVVANEPEGRFNTSSTSFEWFSRQIKNQRIANCMVHVFHLVA